jgi:ribosomal protein L37AE/L43A
MDKHGWLTNKDRRDRRDRSQTLTDNQVTGLLNKIEDASHYSKLDVDLDTLLRLRDEALIGTDWTWFKRGGEVLKLQFGDVTFEGQDIAVSLLIEKKQKRIKFCPYCRTNDKPTKNAIKSEYCKKCGKRISDVEAKVIGEANKRVTKRKKATYTFIQPLIRWYKALEDFKLQPNAWLFPRYHYFSKQFLFYSAKPLTIQRFDQILQKLDFTLTSSMFRYGGAEKYLRLGYTPFELKEIGDWSNSRMPEIYADRKGLLPSQKKFAEDERVL